MMKIRFLAAFVLGCLPLQAIEVWLSGEALLLRPTLDRPYVAIKAASNPSTLPPSDGRWDGEIRPAYSWGYRIEAGHQQGCLFARGTWWSWIHTSHFNDEVDNQQNLYSIMSNLPAAISFVSPGIVRSEVNLKAQGIDVDLGLWTWECHPFSSYLFTGVRYVRIRRKTDIDFTGVFNNAAAGMRQRLESDFQGTGPRAGVYGNYSLCWGFFLSGDASVALLLGSAKGRFFASKSGPTFSSMSTTTNPTSFVIGNVEARFSAGYRLPTFGCFCLNAEAGYQINYYSEGTQRTQFFGPEGGNDAVSAVTRYPFALDGWGFRLYGEF